MRQQINVAQITPQYQGDNQLIRFTWKMTVNLEYVCIHASDICFPSDRGNDQQKTWGLRETYLMTPSNTE